MTTGNAVERVKCLIIGSGPAGYTAAIYAARANLAPVLYTGLQTGGQLTTTTEVENFPGYPEGVTGPVMMEDMRRQAERFGTDIRFGIVTGVNFSGHPHEVTLDGEQTIMADAVIIATGATAKYLGLPSEDRFRGSGVSACATCDGFFYRGKDVAVVGGGDTACEEAIYLAGLCREVYLIVRKNYLRASKVMQQRVFATANIKVLFEHNTVELFGSDMGLEGVRLVYRKGETDEAFKEIRVDGFFLAIGHVPNTEAFKEYLQLDAEGYITTLGTSTRTNVPGVFAAGDVMDPVYRQGITSAGAGCKAAIDAERFLVGL
ncbi:MAG: thioredoxin-disulfide reductase [Odoribacteraceae bacterium]|jgi:thioredoxin reductase (NADPH)|nr:thioredoxin-disulfide reductase [Odoribacteraceae bacterium]